MSIFRDSLERPTDISQIVSDVFDRAYPDLKVIPYAEKADTVGWPEYLQAPEAPGGAIHSVNYRNNPDLYFAVTSMRFMGAAPGLSARNPKDMPQAAIHASQEAFKDGLNLLFPYEALNAYIDLELQEPAYSRNTSYSAFVYVRQEMPMALPAYPPMGGEPRINLQRYNFELDFTEEAQGLLSSPERVRKDHRMLSFSDLRLAYEYSQHRPELWAAFHLWQNIVGLYAGEMKQLMDYMERRNNPSSYQGNLREGVRSEQYRFVDFVQNSIRNNLIFQVFLLPHIVKLAKERGRLRLKGRLDPRDINDGILLANRNGVFRRVFRSEFGKRMGICPFSNHAVELLAKNMGAAGQAKESHLNKCYQKILDERTSNDEVRKYCLAIKEGVRSILSECDFSQLPQESLPSEVGATRPNGCPMRRGAIQKVGNGS